MAVMHNSLILSCVSPDNVFLQLPRAKKVIQISTEAKTHKVKKKICTVHAPSVSFVFVFQTLACREDSKAQAHSSQAGDKMLVRSEVFKSSPIAKGWEISPVLFILFYAAVFRYLTDASMQFPSFGTCFAVEQVKKI